MITVLIDLNRANLIGDLRQALGPWVAHTASFGRASVHISKKPRQTNMYAYIFSSTSASRTSRISFARIAQVRLVLKHSIGWAIELREG